MFIDRISVSVITLNLIPLHVPVFPGFYADIVVLVKTIVDTYTPDAVRRMSLSQASGSSCIAFVFFNYIDPVKTDVQGWMETRSWAETPCAESPSLEIPYLPQERL